MKVKAILRKLQCSPKKVRLVIDKIRGLNANKALSTLLFINKKSADPILKLIKSGIANAENNFKLNKDELILKEIKVDSDGMYKRFTPKARGTATPILKRLSRIEIVLEGDEKEKEEVKIKKVEKKVDKEETKTPVKKIKKEIKDKNN